MADCATCPNAAVVQWSRVNPDDATHVDAVFACPVHAIDLEDAARIHAVHCLAPADGLKLPCCTSEISELPTPDLPPTVLPTGWVLTNDQMES